MRGKRLAYGLIFEPIDPEVESTRLKYRRAIARVFETIIEKASPLANSANSVSKSLPPAWWGLHGRPASACLRSAPPVVPERPEEFG